jgi:hypothetical protein
MSNVAIRRAFEIELNRINVIPTSWEDVDFSPQADTPYREVNMMFARPENPTFGDNHYRQRGYCQITLKWPQNSGAGEVGEYAELIRNQFHRGLSLVADAITTVVELTPEVGNGKVVGDRYVVIVFVRFYADIY